jgi:hypothetical protein
LVTPVQMEEAVRQARRVFAVGKIKQENTMDLLPPFVTGPGACVGCQGLSRELRVRQSQLRLHYALPSSGRSAESSDANEEKFEHNETLLAMARHAHEVAF